MASLSGVCGSSVRITPEPLVEVRASSRSTANVSIEEMFDSSSTVSQRILDNPFRAPNSP